ncbi:MAG: flagellar basal body rod protein FlgC [Roseivivax sp.]|nr:flagellar basal body rod protein FlgC [Roseivivax sp.]
MSDFSSALGVSASALQMQARRIRMISENIANTDTPGYRRKTAAVAPFDGAGTVALGRVRLDQSPLERVYDPGHPLADVTGHFEASNVDLMIEVADAREAQRSYEANLKMFDQTRQMSSELLGLLRR